MLGKSDLPVVFVTGSFDNLQTPQIRFLQEASRLGEVHVHLFSDDLAQKLEGKRPKFPQEERRYFLESIRYISGLTVVNDPIYLNAILLTNYVQENGKALNSWAMQKTDGNSQREAFCKSNNLQYWLITKSEIAGFPIETDKANEANTHKKSVMVSGCFDWVHTGHVRFFEEVSALGDLTVIIGHDANLRLLKGKGHPMFPQDERRYWVQSIRFVKRTQIATGNGWLDAEPEVLKYKPDIFAVNEDGDKPEKRNLCYAHNIEYVVLKREPKPGLPVRISTELRGF